MKYILLWFLFACLVSCSSKLIDSPKPGRGSAKFSRYVAVGGTETSGFADGALYLTGQKNSYPAMLAQQFSLAGSTGISFTQPLMANNNGAAIFNNQLVPKLMLGYYHYACGNDSMFIPIRSKVVADGSLLLPASSPPFNNLGMPGLRADDLNDANLSLRNIYSLRMKGDSAINTLDIIRSNPPTFFTLWIGTQDILDYALAGGDAARIPSAASFETALNLALDALTTDSAAGGVIANIPDITEFPYFNALALNGLPLDTNLANGLNAVYIGRGFNFHVGSNPFVIADAADPNGSRLLKPDEKVLLSVPLDSIKCNLLGSFHPMPTNYVLNTAEVQRIQQAVADYNQVIATVAAARKIPLVDLNAMYHSLAAGGIQVNGMLFTNALVTGYFFSLDGLNPSYRGNAMIANEMIKKINSSYRATIPTLDPTIYTGPLFP